MCNILWKIPGQLYCILILHAFFRSGSNDFYFILYFHPKVVITQSRFAGMKFQLVQRGQIPSYEYKGKSDFIPVRRDSFPPGNFLDLYAFSICIWKHLLINLFVSLRRDKAISSRQSRIPAVQKRDPALQEWNLSHVIAEYNLWRVYNNSGT